MKSEEDEKSVDRELDQIKDEVEQKLNSENFQLNKETRNRLRKVFLRTLKKVLTLKKIIELEMAKQVKIDDIHIPVFDGSNHSSWEFRILNILEYKECKDQATRERTQGDVEATWNKSDLKAKTIVISSISDKQLEYIRDCKTTFEIMEKFKSMYTTKSTALQIVCRGKLEDVKLKNYELVEDFFVDFEKSCNKLKTAGGSLSEQEKMRYLIKALPPNYSYIGDFIDLVPEKERTVDYVKSKILEKNMSKSEAENKRNASTFNIKVRGNCHNCGRQGHHIKDCWRPSQTHQNQNMGEKTNQSQSYTRGRGQQKFRSQQRGNSRGIHRGRGRGRATNQQGEETTSQANDDTFAGTWLAEVKHTEVNQVNAENEIITNQINWLLDSGCTDHIINSEKYFEKFVVLSKPIDVKMPDGKNLKATKIGNIRTYFKTYYGENEIILKNVYYVNGINKNLLSFSKITENNTIISRDQNAKIYDKNRKLVAVADKVNDLYVMKSFIYKIFENDIFANTVKLTNKEKWHRALGHINFQYLDKLVNEKLIEGLPEKLETNVMKCANCIQSKMANVPFQNKRNRANEILEIIHTDLNGPHKTTGYKGEKYFLSFIDDYSKVSRIYCIKSKADVADCFEDYVNLVENQLNKRVKKIRCDNGKEYLNHRIDKFIRDKGIELLPCPPYVHELNGVAERFNRAAMDMGRCLQREAKIHTKYWPEIMKTVSYLKNRTIANSVENKTPFEIFFCKKPNVKNLKIYGSLVFVRNPEVKRNSKWDDKSNIGKLVGYNHDSYRVLIDNKIINARHVDIVEEGTELICLEKVNDDEIIELNLDFDRKQDQTNEIIDNESNESTNEANENTNEIENIVNNNDTIIENEINNDCENLSVKRTSKRKKSPVQRYGNPVTHFIYVNYVDANVPNTFEEAQESKDFKNWQKAMNSEIKSLNKNNTWIIVDKPKDRKIIDVKWVYKRKSDNSYKARLVVRGFQQRETLENVYSPVGKMQTLKILLSYCCVNDLYIEQMDVETAFLNGPVKSEVYIHEPKGFETGENKVCKLIKALYGLKESPRAWYETLHEYLEKLNFIRSRYDYCLYVNKSSNDTIYILVFVDDILICCKNYDKIKNIKIRLMEKFTMKDMGKLKLYIGIEIEHDKKEGIMTLCQQKYIESLAIKYNLENSKTYNTPMETNLKLDQATEIDENIKYRNLIGELLYISTGTRPDIAFSVNYLSRYQNCYDSTHFKYALRVLKYLYKTKDLKLTYTHKNKIEQLDCMVDSDFAGDHVDRKSTTGFIIRVYGNVIYWKAQKQKIVTKNSTFAEYIALSDAVTEVIFVKDLLKDTFNVKTDKQIKIYEDNSGAVAIGKFGNFTKNSKHIEVQHHYVNENYEKGVIDIIKIETDKNIADILTKSLCKEKFVKIRKLLNVK